MSNRPSGSVSQISVRNGDKTSRESSSGSAANFPELQFWHSQPGKTLPAAEAAAQRPVPTDEQAAAAAAAAAAADHDDRHEPPHPSAGQLGELLLEDGEILAIHHQVSAFSSKYVNYFQATSLFLRLTTVAPQIDSLLIKRVFDDWIERGRE